MAKKRNKDEIVSKTETESKQEAEEKETDETRREEEQKPTKGGQAGQGGPETAEAPSTGGTGGGGGAGGGGGQEGGPAGGGKPGGKPGETDKAQQPEATKPGDVSPQLPKEGMPEPVKVPDKKGTKEKENKAKEALKDKAAEEPGKKAAREMVKQLAKRAAQAIARYAAAAASAVVAALGWPVVAGCIIVFIIIVLIFGSLMCISMKGYFGKSYKHAAGKDNKDVIALVDATKKDGAAKDTHKLDFANKRDLEYLESGEIDARLAAALNYIVQRHEHIRVSHIVSGYEDMKTDPESGAFHDIQITKNISAHKEGLAADIDEIDYVKQQCKCGDPIPVKIAWQAIGESAFGTAPDVLNTIKGAVDLAKTAVKDALEKAGIKGLDQPDIEAKLQTIEGISSPFDLTKPGIIAALNSIGVTGIDNPDLQSGLKRLQALQNLYDLAPEDLSALTSGTGADLMSQIGINLTSDTISSINKYQNAQILQTIKSVDDLNNPDVQNALRYFNIDPNDQNFRTSLDKMAAANTVMNWTGDYSDARFQEALAKTGVKLGSEFEQAYDIYQGAKSGFQRPAGTIEADISTFKILDMLNITIDNPDAQKVYDTYRAATQVSQWQGGFNDPNLVAALTKLNLTNPAEYQPFLDKYQAAQYIINSRGSLDDPQLQASMQKLGISADQLDQIRQADAMVAIASHTNLQSLMPETYQKFQDIQNLINVRDINAIKTPAVQKTLQDLGINMSTYYGDIVKLGSLNTILNISNLDAANAASVQKALSNLGLSSAQGVNFGYLGSIQSLANIKNPMDLTRPEVQTALKNLGVDTSSLGSSLGKAGDINALMNIQNPQDLLSAGSVKALGDLGIINVNSEMMGQIGAIQTLLQVHSITDLFNPSSILALNTLGLISLSNPAIAALMAINMISQFLGIDLFGGLGSCKGNTDCYKPTAQANIHKVIGELLQFPKDMGDVTNYRLTQIITFSEQRDVIPFAAQLDELYDKDRPKNYGLFAMPEASGNLHIGY